MSAPGALRRFLLLVGVSFAALQLYFLVAVAALRVVDVPSTTMQRSEAWRLATGPAPLRWQQPWTRYDKLPASLKRAVIAAEDAGFVEHSGIEWDALEKAWGRNVRAEAAAQRAAAKASGREPPRAAAAEPSRTVAAAKVVGGSTISQQLAKNLFLSGERSFLRKAQELVVVWELEWLLGKRRILEIYLNDVEWGEGIFGADAAARRYFGVGVASLSPAQSAQLAVMLPAPKRFEKRPGSSYVVGRAATIADRAVHVDLP